MDAILVRHRTPTHHQVQTPSRTLLRWRIAQVLPVLRLPLFVEDLVSPNSVLNRVVHRVLRPAVERYVLQLSVA